MKCSVQTKLPSFVFILCLGFVVLSAKPAFSSDSFPFVYFQGYVGGASFDEDSLTFYEPSNSDPDVVSTTDLSSMPYLGLSAQFALGESQTHFGIDSSLLFGWRSNDSSVVAGNGQARVNIDSNLWLLDLAVGVYSQTIFANRWRLYGAVGPLLLFGDYSDDTEEETLTGTSTTEQTASNSDSAFGYGGYAKVGLEYAISHDAFIGIAARGITTNLEFDRAVDDDGLGGLQGFVTFTRLY